MSEPVALLLAFGFGLAYNALLTRRMAADGGRPRPMALWVVGGVLATLALSALVEHQTIRLVLHWQGRPIQLTNAQHAALFELRFFVATGAPLAAGSLWRYWQRL